MTSGKDEPLLLGAQVLEEGEATTTKMTSDKDEPLLLGAQVVEDGEATTTKTTSPFSSNFPSVFEEANDMILASIMVYGVVDLRTLARKGMLSSADVLRLPISSADIVRLVSLNRSRIQDQIGEDSTDLYLDAFDSLVEDDAFELEYNAETGQTSLASFDVVDVGDEFIKRELVYGMCVQGAKKRITVAFRGCTTAKDWRVSADPFLSSHDNPVVPANPKRISIHRGFYKYLFSPNKVGVTKYESILNKIQSLKEQNPGYSVYITGHSLGGALATVFGFYAAASRSVGTVTCIPIASPMVGNLSFEHAFKVLEKQGSIRCLRITNHFDIFTQTPDRSALLYAFFFWEWAYLMGATFLFFLLCQNNVYRHVGMDLHLYSTEKFKIKHARGSADVYWKRVFQDWKKHWKQALQRLIAAPFVCFCERCYCQEDFNKNHSIQEHRSRLCSLSSELQRMYLNELYDGKRFEIV